MTITNRLLEDTEACQEGKDFFRYAFPNGLDLDKVKITGDFRGFYSWIKNTPRIEYNDLGLMVKKTYPDGSIWRYEYNDRGLMVKYTYPSGTICLCAYTFDTQNRLIEMFVNKESVCMIEYLEDVK